MTDLSPAARAVLKAACIHHGLFNEEIIQRRRMIAAALRAAADQIQPSQQDYAESCHEFAKVFLNGMACAANDLRRLAAELDPPNS